MEYRRLGNSGLKLSTIGLGSWLTYGTATPDGQAVACIRRAYDLGINHFDCANKYGEVPHAAERVLGEALRGRPRGSYVLTTKVFYPVGPGPTERGLSRKHMTDQVHASLAAFDTEYIDILYCHRFDPETPLAETLQTLDDLVAQGKVLYYGISEFSPAQTRQAAAIARELRLRPITVTQPVYNLLARRIESEELPLAQELGLGLVTFSALGQGALTGKYAPGQVPEGSRAAAAESVSHLVRTRYLNPEQLAQVERLKAVADELGLTLAQLALAWVLRQPAIASALVGASRPEQLEENVKAAGVTLPAAALSAIDEIFG
jgi:aryl-alcohol dehydrogenase-like predicted oxidoreductase